MRTDGYRVRFNNEGQCECLVSVHRPMNHRNCSCPQTKGTVPSEYLLGITSSLNTMEIAVIHRPVVCVRRK